VKLDLHVHTVHSGATTIYPLDRVMNESYNAFVPGGILGLPLVCLPLAAALVHFILEDRFNQALLFDLVKRPAMRAPEVA
jgi:hypothetical protein